MLRLQLLTVCLMLCTLSYGQNQSDNNVQPGISIPIPQQFGGQEIFRFQPGLVTQLGQGSGSFGFNEKWFSIGELNTGSQMVYGLRFQLPNRALTFGYQDTSDNNPRIQWIGEGQGLGNLEFRMADNFTSTSSNLVATMRNDGATRFGDGSSITPSQVTITSFDNFGTGLTVEQQNNNNPAGTGIFLTSVGTNAENRGLLARVGGAQNVNIGLKATIDPTAQSNFGIFSDVPVTGNSFAGFFDGEVFLSNGFIPSDQGLKENIDEFEGGLDKILKLKPKTYQYIKSEKINLSEGNQYGFIAQELEEVFPELIKEISKPVFNDKDKITEYLDIKSVNYLGLIAVLTDAIQELAEEVDRLKETNESYVVFSDRLDAEEMERLRKLAYQLEQNYPNPFQGRTSIEYSIPDDERNASIMVFNMTGKLLKEFKLREKTGKIEITSDEFQPGIYLYSLISDNNEIITKKMIVK